LPAHYLELVIGLAVLPLIFVSQRRQEIIFNTIKGNPSKTAEELAQITRIPLREVLWFVKEQQSIY